MLGKLLAAVRVGYLTDSSLVARNRSGGRKARREPRLRRGTRNTELAYQPSNGHDVAWLAVATGGLNVDGKRLRREMAVFEAGGEPIEVVAQGDVELVIASAMKHPYPLVTGYYSVHTSQEALVRGEAGYAAIAKTMSLEPGQPID
jgi:hypothetical protein